MGKSKSKKIVFVICLILTNIIFSIDVLVDWGLLSGMLYIVVVLLALISPRKKEHMYFAWLSSVYIIFEVVVLMPEHTLQSNFLDHAGALVVMWSLVFFINRHASMKNLKE